MIVFRAIMNVRPEKQKEVLQTLISLMDQPRNNSGCLSYGIFCDIEDKNIFNLVSEWETRQDLDHYISSNIFTVLLGTKSLLSEPWDIQILTVSHTEGMDAVNLARKKS